MTCREFADFLLDYVDGHLEPEVRRTFDEHVAACPPCVRYLQHYTETVKASRLAMADDDVPADLPEGLVTAILKARS